MELLQSENELLVKDGELATDSCATECCNDCPSALYRRLLGECGDIYLCVDSTTPDGTRLDQINRVDPVPDPIQYVVIRNGRCYQPSQEYYSDPPIPGIPAETLTIIDANEVGDTCNRYVIGIACPGEQPDAVVWFPVRNPCVCVMYRVTVTIPGLERAFCMRADMGSVATITRGQIGDDDYRVGGAGGLQLLDQFDNVVGGVELRPSTQCCDCVPECAGSTTSSLVPCWSNPGTYDCCCNDRNFTFLRFFDQQEWEKRGLLPGTPVIWTEYDEQLIHPERYVAVDGVITIAEPMVVRKTGREWISNGSDGATPTYVNIDETITYPLLLNVGDSSEANIDLFCPRPAFVFVSESERCPGVYADGTEFVSGSISRGCYAHMGNQKFDYFTRDFPPYPAFWQSYMLSKSETILYAPRLGVCDGGCEDLVGSETVPSAAVRRLSFHARTGVAILDSILGAP